MSFQKFVQCDFCFIKITCEDSLRWEVPENWRIIAEPNSTSSMFVNHMCDECLSAAKRNGAIEGAK